jgi:hypothetical protein
MFGNALGNCIYDKQHVKKFKSQATVRIVVVVRTLSLTYSAHFLTYSTHSLAIYFSLLL